MSRKTYVGEVDKVLKPLGFTRAGREWSRTVGSVLEQVTLYSSWLGLGTTADLLSKDLATGALLMEAIPRRKTGVGTGVRISHLMPGKPKDWWKNTPESAGSGNGGATELAAAIGAYAPAWFEARRSLEDQAKVYGRGATRWTSGLYGLYLAFTLYRMGEKGEACEAIANPSKWLMRAIGPDIEAARRWLGCSCQGDTGTGSKD